jgi:hypothetical protein
LQDRGGEEVFEGLFHRLEECEMHKLKYQKDLVKYMF